MSAKKSDPRVVVLVLFVIVLIAGAVFLRLWANAQRLEVPNFRTLAVSAQGDVHVVFGDTLFIESSSGELLRRIELADWGVGAFHGDIAVLEDGSVVLARGQLDDVSAGEAVRIAARATSTDDPAEKLMRCQPATGECRILDANGNGATLGRTFSIAADNAALYASEPAKHRVLKLSFDGELLAESHGEWRFPNSVRVAGAARIGFADTNHHRYVEVSSATETFGKQIHDTDIAGWPGIVRAVRFPSEAMTDSNGTLWMLVADTNMGNADLYRVPENGAAKHIDLTDDADPTDLVETAGSILVADWQNFRIHRFNLAGEAQPDFGSPALKNVLDEHRSQHDLYQDIFDYSLIAVLVVALGALVFGYHLQKRADAERAIESEDLVTADGNFVYEPASLEGQYAKLTGEFIFWRKYSALGTKAERVLLIVGLALPIVMLALAGCAAMFLSKEEVLARLLAGSPLLILLAIAGVMLIAMWFTSMFERLVISREGIRYTSPLPAPFSRALFPSWSLTWAEIESVRLVPGSNPKMPAFWKYSVITRDGKQRHVSAFAWRLAGEHESGVPLRSLTRMTPEIIRSAIQKTLLYRLLGKGMGGAERREAA